MHKILVITAQLLVSEAINTSVIRKQNFKHFVEQGFYMICIIKRNLHDSCFRPIAFDQFSQIWNFFAEKHAPYKEFYNNPWFLTELSESLHVRDKADDPADWMRFRQFAFGKSWNLKKKPVYVNYLIWNNTDVCKAFNRHFLSPGCLFDRLDADKVSVNYTPSSVVESSYLL